MEWTQQYISFPMLQAEQITWKEQPKFSVLQGIQKAMRTGPKSNYHLEENNKYIHKVYTLTEHTAQSYNRITKHNKSKTYPHSTSKEKTKETEQAYALSLLDVEYLGNDV